jgi:hypothetical protein
MPLSPIEERLRQRVEDLAATIQRDLIALASKEYPSDSPRDFVLLIQELVGELENVVRVGANPDTARLVSHYLKGLAGHLRLIESSTYPNIPWALIRPLESLLGDVLPGSRFVFRSKWGYNYTIQQVTKNYRDSLSGLPSQLFDSGSFFDRHGTWAVVSLPRVDRDAVLLHALLGHEAGHPVADAYLAAEDQTQVQRAIQNEVGDGTWIRADIAQRNPIERVTILGKIYQTIEQVRTRAIQELTSDLTGWHLFGPSFLLALRDLFLDCALDDVPAASQFYPPNRMRLRLLYEEHLNSGFPRLIASLDSSVLASRLPVSFADAMTEIASIATSDIDLKAIDSQPIMARAYRLARDVMPAVNIFVLEKLGDLRYEKTCKAKDIGPLIDCLALGIPPIAEGSSGRDVRDSMLAGWLYRVANIPVPFSGAAPQLADRQKLQRLVHKAIEYCELEQEYQSSVR